MPRLFPQGRLQQFLAACEFGTSITLLARFLEGKASAKKGNLGSRRSACSRQRSRNGLRAARRLPELVLDDGPAKQRPGICGLNGFPIRKKLGGSLKISGPVRKSRQKIVRNGAARLERAKNLRACHRLVRLAALLQPARPLEQEVRALLGVVWSQQIGKSARLRGCMPFQAAVNNCVKVPTA